MLTSRTPDLTAIIWEAARIVGRDPAKVADHIIHGVCPLTLAAAETEGFDRMLRSGLVEFVKRKLRGSMPEVAQGDFADVDASFRALAAELKSEAYFVESLGEQVPVARLIAEPELLDDARRFMRRKGDECIAEAVRLDLLFDAVMEARS